jgi:glutaminase
MESKQGKRQTHFRMSVSIALFCSLFLVWVGGVAAWIDDRIPTGQEIQSALKLAHESLRDVNEGQNANYIPYLADVDPRLFGIAIATVDGTVYEVGDSTVPFAMESISKIFTLCRVIQDLGPGAIEDKIGLNASGLPFNSVLAIELNRERGVNPFVNAGAMATVSLISGRNAQERWEKIMGTMNLFSSRALTINEEVYRSESETNEHNKAIVYLLKSYNRLYSDPEETLDLYTRQCSVAVSTRDLAIMGATLANGGVNPITGQRALNTEYVPTVLALMMTAGLYDTTGEWVFRTGLPGKSGVGGGIVAVIPGKYAIAAFSPPLDPAGNSVRAQKAIIFLSQRLGANLFLGR